MRSEQQRTAFVALDDYFARKLAAAEPDDRWRVAALRSRVAHWADSRPDAYWASAPGSVVELVRAAAREDAAARALLADLAGETAAPAAASARSPRALELIEQARAGLLALRRFDAERVEAVTGLFDAVAAAWAERHNSTPERWWETRVAGFHAGGTHVEAGLPFDSDQPVTAATAFLNSGLALIFAFESADVSSVSHECGHLLRRDLEGEDLAAVEAWLGIPGGRWVDGHFCEGRWSRDAEERFARAFEKYLWTGEAPTPRLADVFATLKRYLRRIYLAIEGSVIDVHLPAVARRVFSKLLGGEDRLHNKQDRRLPAPGADRKDPVRRDDSRACPRCGCTWTLCSCRGLPRHGRER